ncbi:cysteine desulfurase NifS [Rhodococcus erythropolis]|nr:cysteine desulfurase NifS [Rhodococcus erythropolis]
MNTGIPDLCADAAPWALAGKAVYTDYNATTPVDPRVVRAMLPFLSTDFGNPSSAHEYGLGPSVAIDHARAQVANLVGAAAQEILFTGSGSEADATAIRGVVTAARSRGIERPHVITQASEHPAVLAACEYAERHHDAQVRILDTDSDGLVAPSVLAAAMTPATVLVSIMHANNETGVLQPVAQLARIAHEGSAVFHTDAAQSVGKIAVDVDELGVDLLTLVGHKLYAPKGVAALYIRDGVELEPLIGGGGQERGMRAGTENVPFIVALGCAAELAAADLASGSAARLERLREEMIDELARRLPGRVHVNGSAAPRLPQTANISIDGTAGHQILADAPDVAASVGSACHAGNHQPSPVLTAMGIDASRAIAALRLSMGRWSTEADVARVVNAITTAAGGPEFSPPS